MGMASFTTLGKHLFLYWLLWDGQLFSLGVVSLNQRSDYRVGQSRKSMQELMPFKYL